MLCVVTAGPTFEPLDRVRRLTNFSTGRLGTELARFLAAQGHDVILLIGQQAGAQVKLAQTAAHQDNRPIRKVEIFTTTNDLAKKLQALSTEAVDAVFHTAAVCDFAFGNVWVRTSNGEFVQAHSGKISTELGTIIAELVPTAKVIGKLREWFPKARLVGWKYDVDGNRTEVINHAKRQIAQYNTDACVANGPAYGAGFGLITRDGKSVHVADELELFTRLESLLRT